ncbi:MAG: ring-opening amidohydrolase [Casimicrobiaceae bacterium]
MKAHRIMKVPQNAPDDLGSVEKALKEQGVAPSQIKAVMCQTEGDGLARGYASLAFSVFFHRALGWDIRDVPRRIPLIMIGGCSGLVTPYAALFVEDKTLDGEADEPGLSIGSSTTPDIDIEAFGKTAMVDMVADAVRAAMDEAGLKREDIHNVQIKAPWPETPALIAAKKAGKNVATLDGGRAGALARGSGALGVAVALNEIDRKRLTDADICDNWSLRSDIASASAGTERTNVAVIVMGNSRKSRSPYRIGHGVMRDGIDVGGVYAALASAGISAKSPLEHGPENPVDHVFLKSAVEMATECRGRRHTLTTDYLAPYSWLIAKAAIHASVASVVGDPMMQVSGGGEHQGPQGGGLVAVVAKK